MREPSWSLVPTAKWGLRSVGACHQSVLSGPPPPRLLGANAPAFGWAWATPATASIWAARGAVSPSPIIAWTKCRRLIRPALTSSIIDRSSRSCIGISLLDHVHARLEALVPAAARGTGGPLSTRWSALLLVGFL